MKKDEFEVIENPFKILGGGPDDIGDVGDDEKDESKEQEEEEESNGIDFWTWLWLAFM